MPRLMNASLRICLLLSLLTGCERVHYNSHEFAPAAIGLEGGMHASVAAYGSWQIRKSGDSTIRERGSPYAVEVRLHGELQPAYSVEVQLIDPVTLDTTRVTQWSTSTIDAVDSSRVLAYRNGLHLSARAHSVRVVLRFANDADAERTRVGNGILQHSLTQSTRLRVLERVKGL